jgi:type VI secretion system protein ImpK
MRLIDCFINIISFVAFFLKSPGVKQSSYDKVKGNIQRLIAQSESCIENEKISREDYNLARFAVLAWVDEAIMSSSWDGRVQWQREKLQRLYYQTEDAGEIFFDRLNTLGFQKREVREVFYMCLVLGFTGQYCNAGDDVLLEALKDENLKILTGNSIDASSFEKHELFPEAYQIESARSKSSKPKGPFSFFALMCFIAPVVFLGGLFLLYRILLENFGETILF